MNPNPTLAHPSRPEQAAANQATGQRPRHDPPSWAARLRFLSEGTDAVLETHMAWLFFKGALVRKLKKPVRYPFLDFSTVAARERMGREELRLNRRLAHDVYLGLDVLDWDGQRLRLMPEAMAHARQGHLDWLVRMRRLPEARMLNTLIANQTVSHADIDTLAATLIRFYRHQPAVEHDPAAVLARFEREHARNRALLLGSDWGLHGVGHAIADFEAQWCDAKPRLAERVRAGRIVEGHGDLRPQHICLLTHPTLIDALEFNAALRAVDPFDELAALDLECAMLGAPWIGPQLVTRLAQALHDPTGAALVPWYRHYRALLRARLALAHRLEAKPRTPERWQPLAQHFIDLVSRRH